MNKTAWLGAAALMAALLGCGDAQKVASAPACPDSWTSEATADSSIALCVAPGFSRLDAHTWQRTSTATGEDLADFFSVELVQWPQDSAALHRWPPKLASGPSCQADCITIDSGGTYQDKWAGFEAETEVGLATGGLAGLTRRPVMVSGWVVSKDRRGFAQGWTAHPTTLDTLRTMLRTVRIVKQ